MCILHYPLKGIVSRDFQGLQMILMDRAWAPGIPLYVYFLKFMFSYRFYAKSFKWVKGTVSQEKFSN